jgi:hypothetical protein
MSPNRFFGGLEIFLFFMYCINEVDMTEFKCDTRRQGYFLYGKNKSVFTVLYGCIIIVGLFPSLPLAALHFGTASLDVKPPWYE